MNKIIAGLFIFIICFSFVHPSFAMSHKKINQNHSNLIELGAKAYVIGYKIEQKVLIQKAEGEISSNTMTNRCSIAVKKIGNHSSMLFLEAKCLQGAEAQAMISMATQEALKLAS